MDWQLLFISYLYLFFFYSPRWRFVLQTEISGKYNSPHYFCFLSKFFYHSSCRKDPFTVKFKIWILVIQVYKRSGGPSLVCRCGFAFTSVSAASRTFVCWRPSSVVKYCYFYCSCKEDTSLVLSFVIPPFLSSLRSPPADSLWSRDFDILYVYNMKIALAGSRE